MPEVTVVVPSHERPLRLRWLLNALEEQSLPRERWEVVVVHDSAGPETERLLTEHPLANAGVLRHVRLATGTGTPSRQRNVGWRTAHAHLVAFTDDDCRPTRTWLEQLLAHARRNEGAIVQGAVRPDPFETDVFAAPRVRSLYVAPPGPFAQTANILYPRALLERVGGFDERFPTAGGEDTDLALRARATGVGYVGASEALVFHAVESYSLAGALRLSRKWEHLPRLVKRHRSLRGLYPLRIFWQREHMWLTLALTGAAFSFSRRVFAALALPYLTSALLRRGIRTKAVLRCAAELPAHSLVTLSELLALVRGSVRYRSLFL